jgi:hypothetical protein
MTDTQAPADSSQASPSFIKLAATSIRVVTPEGYGQTIPFTGEAYGNIIAFTGEPCINIIGPVVEAYEHSIAFTGEAYGNIIAFTGEPCINIIGPVVEAYSNIIASAQGWYQESVASGTTALAQPEAPESSTQQKEKQQPDNILGFLHNIFDQAVDEDFEDGMESRFSNALISFIRTYHNQAMAEIAYLIAYEKLNYQVSAEALRWLGRINDPPTHSYRLWLLERSLSSRSAAIRDAASLGIASLGDPHAIPYLETAITHERIEELRNDLTTVLLELKSSNYGKAPEKNS